MEKVLPLLTAPSQMIASQCGFFHQLITRTCLGEKRMPLFPILVPQRPSHGLQSLIQPLCPVVVALLQQSE